MASSSSSAADYGSIPVYFNSPAAPSSLRRHGSLDRPTPDDCEASMSSENLLSRQQRRGGNQRPRAQSVDNDAHPPHSSSPMSFLSTPKTNGGGEAADSKDSSSLSSSIAHQLIYAGVNVILSVPSLYGYAAVIFNHPAFAGHMNALVKLVVFSSCVHQLGFTLMSGLPFAIGTVQDAGLIFLSVMANAIANSILEKGGSVDEVVSTTLVILPLGTAALGAVLVALGKFKLLDIVSYLPMPVVGGYLAFIGYFCLEAGVALCISKPMTTLGDWAYLLDPKLLLLSAPGLLAAALLTVLSRKATNDAALPAAMVAMPALFYLILMLTGTDLSSARDAGWVGEVAPPVPVQDLFRLVDFNLVHWSAFGECVGTWVGMVFVVTFASCLDVAAISMDMGEALDVNREMMVVGTCNIMSGLSFGFTGSYIFSQTIFTYRTGCHSRNVGIIVMFAFLAVCVSTVNILQIAPLFFLAACLIFIGYDLMWEWLIDIRHKMFFTEYIVLLTTFVAIQILGMNFGIVFGVVVALFDHVASTTRGSSIERVSKRSRSIWGKGDRDMLQVHGYNGVDPEIVTLAVKGPIFFGSSQKLLQDIIDEIGLDMSDEERLAVSHASPHVSTPISNNNAKSRTSPGRRELLHPTAKGRPRYVILELSDVHNLDASAASSCFLQLAKICEKRGVFICAAGAVPRVEWILRSHDVAYSFDEETKLKESILGSGNGSARDPAFGKLTLFLTIFEALDFAERLLLRKLSSKMPRDKNICLRTNPTQLTTGPTRQRLTSIFHRVLRGGLVETDKDVVDGIEPYYEEVEFSKGEVVFTKDTRSDAFFVVICGEIAIPCNLKGDLPTSVMSGAGKIKPSGSLSNLFGASEEEPHSAGLIKSFHTVGGVFGYCDFLLQRNRLYEALASSDGTIVAKFTEASVEKMKMENQPLYAIVQNLLLHVSILDLANCTCHN